MNYRYQHNIELVKFLNFFANKNAQLPHGWEKKDCSSKVYISNKIRMSIYFINAHP